MTEHKQSTHGIEWVPATCQQVPSCLEEREHAAPIQLPDLQLLRQYIMVWDGCGEDDSQSGCLSTKGRAC